MDGDNDRVSPQLAQVHAGLAVLRPEDRDALIPLGAALEQIVLDLPDDPPCLAGALSCALEALQALFLGETLDASSVLRTATLTVRAALEVMRSQSDTAAVFALEEAHHTLDRAMEGGTCEEAPSDSEGSQPITLNDLALMLMQLAPGDADGCDRLHEALASCASDATLCAEARRCLCEAGSRLDDLRGQDEMEVALTDVGRLVEAAMGCDEPEGAQANDPVPDDERAPAEMPAAHEADAEPDAGPAELLPPDYDAALLGEFVTECEELLANAEAALLALEADLDDAESINTVFRAFHTIKGTSAFLGIGAMSELAHEAETLLSRMRDGEIACSGRHADLALRALDGLKDLVLGVHRALAGEAAPIPEGLAELRRLLASPESATEPAAAAPPARSTEPAAAAPARPSADPARRARSESPEESTVRVRTDRLDRLIEMVGELVIAQSMVAQDPSVLSGTVYDLSRKVGHAGKIVRELQDLSLSMRMVPLKPTFRKMTRLVRDLAQKSGKVVDFTTEGDDTEIDRNMVDLISDPLVHLIRNAVDHGIEPPEHRVQAGKSSAGRVRLHAYHSSGSVVVEVRDDGRGLDRDRILARAAARGLVEPGKAMADREVFDLIFAPGFSTAEQVTEISGRGVGMDVVRRSVEALRGRIDITSEPGQGCTFALRVPLTLAITDGMLVRVGHERYVIPTTSIHICFRPDGTAISTLLGRGEMVSLRDEMMPLFRLHRLFEVDGAVEDPREGLLVVVGTDGRKCALLVDELLGQQQVVAKSLGSTATEAPGVSGGAILGDGRVGLILDVAALVTLAQQVATDGRSAPPRLRLAA